MFFEIAKNYSQLSDFHNRIGCIVVYHNNIISSGFSSQKTHPIQKRYNKFKYNTDNTPHKVHAEIKALAHIMNRKDIDWSKISLYIYREKNCGGIGLARPCIACMSLIKDLRIPIVYYTTDDGFVKEEIV